MGPVRYFHVRLDPSGNRGGGPQQPGLCDNETDFPTAPHALALHTERRRGKVYERLTHKNSDTPCAIEVARWFFILPLSGVSTTILVQRVLQQHTNDVGAVALLPRTEERHIVVHVLQSVVMPIGELRFLVTVEQAPRHIPVHLIA